MSVLFFGEFRLDPINKRLWRGEQTVDLGGLPFAVLCHLVERSTEGRLVSKRELRERIWGGTHVSDEAIRGCVSTLRKALGDDPSEPRIIKTQNKEGFRFLLPVVQTAPSSVAQGRVPQPPNGPYDATWYVKRSREEREIHDCLAYRGRPVVVFGPQGCGKTTLIRRALESEQATQPAGTVPGIRILWTSLRGLTEAHLQTMDTMLLELGRLLLDPNGEEEERAQQILGQIWTRGILAPMKFKQLVRTHIAPSAARVVLVFSAVEHLVGWRHQSSWLDMLRAWQESDDVPSLRLILETSVPPRLYPLGGGSPMWTKSRRIDASELSVEQISEMAELYGLRTSSAACQQLAELVGNHAALCRHALYQAAVRSAAIETLLAEVQPDQRLFGVFTEPLQDLQLWLEQHAPPKSLPGERAPVHRLLPQGNQRVTLPPEEAWPLIRKGLLRETEQRGQYRLRCRLYEDFFRGRT